MLVIYGIVISLYSDQSNFPWPRTLLKSYSVGFRHMKKMCAARFKPNRAVNGFQLFFQRFLVIKMQFNRKNYVQIVLSCTCNNIIGLSGEFTQRKISSQQVRDKRGAKTCSTAL